MGAKLFGMRRFNNFLLIDATDRSKISGDQKRFFKSEKKTICMQPLHLLKKLLYFVLSNFLFKPNKQEKTKVHFLCGAKFIQKF